MTNGYLAFDATSNQQGIVQDVFGFMKQEINIKLDPATDKILSKFPKSYFKKYDFSFETEYSTYNYDDKNKVDI